MKAMKKVLIFIVCLISILLKGQDIYQRPFGIKSGIIEYSFYGDKVGKGTLWFDDYGLKCAMYTEVTYGTRTSKGWIVSTGGFQYSWDPAKNAEGVKTKNPILIWANEAPVKGIDSYYESIYVKMGMRRYGNETFIKRECRVFKGDIGKLAIWQGIIMRLDLKTSGTITYQAATSVKTNVVINPKYFVIPKTVKFTEKPAQ